ncbi:MAG TPA: OsmC family protein [Arthrobacter sp.]|nr:OsmC family protein [Arthrobacter sp.]
MGSETLRAVQAPLKQQYRDDPGAAMITLNAEGELGMDVSCSINTGRAIAAAGLHPATGGDGSLVCSGDMLLQALAACAGVTLQAVASSLGLSVSGTVHAEGDLDFRGTLAVDKTVPVGFQDIRVRFDLTSDANDEQLDKLLQLTERYCVVYQTLVRPPALSVTRASDAQAHNGGTEKEEQQ